MADNLVVHLVDDDEDVRRTMAFMLGTAGLPVKVYDSATALLQGLDPAQPGCIVSDVRMPGMDGIQLVETLRRRNVTLPVIIMTGHGDIGLAVRAMKAGAADFLEKPFADDVLLAAIEAALDKRPGAAPADPGLAQLEAKLASLSERETQVMDGLVAGRPNKTIAYDLGISARTVEIHRANVMRKMGASSLSELVRMALKAGRG